MSENPENRLKQHNNGLSTWTAKYGPWQIKWTSHRLSLLEARKLENALKRQKGGRGLETLIKKYGS